MEELKKYQKSNLDDALKRLCPCSNKRRIQKNSQKTKNKR